MKTLNFYRYYLCLW